MKLGDILASNAQRFPEREALVCGDRRLTFGQLDAQANRIANALLGLGLEYGDRVAIYMPNRAEAVEAMCGVLKSGGLIVPISSRLAAPEVRYIFNDCTPAVIFHTEEFRDQAIAAAEGLDNPPARIVVGNAGSGEIAYEAMIAGASPATPPRLSVASDDCVIGYTSGTTGRPKGAIGTHINMVVLQGYLNGTDWRSDASETILATTPLAHRTGLSRVANSILQGIRLVVMERFDAAAALDVIEREKVTVLSCVPTIVRMLMPEVEKRPEACRSLKLLTATGEVFPVPLKDRLRKAVPWLGLHTFYAQTEAGAVCSLMPEDQESHPDAMGRASRGIEVRLVDQDFNDVPKGEPGEIVVRSGLPGMGAVMRAYYNNEEANREGFVDGWLRTGDMAYEGEDGFYYFVDRVRDMIVSGGLNIYSKEVELALSDHDDVADAAVIGVPDGEFGEAVMAFVEPVTGKAPDPDALIEFCRTRIASYKKPKYVRLIDALPRTTSGKVTKNVLRRRAAEEFGRSHGGAWQNEIENESQTA